MTSATAASAIGPNAEASGASSPRQRQPAPLAVGRELRGRQPTRVQRREVIERRGRRVRAMGDRRGDRVHVVAQAAGLAEQRFGECGVGGEPRAQLRRRRGVERAGMLEPIGDVFGRLQMVLARRKAAPRFAVGKIQREIAGDQCDSAGARRGQGWSYNRHNYLYRLIRRG